MTVERSLVSILCSAIARIIISSLLKNGSSEKAVREDIVDRLKNFISNPSDQEKAQRSIEKIAQQIVAQMQPIFDLALSASRHGREEQNQAAEIISRSLTEEIAVNHQQEEINPLVNCHSLRISLTIRY
jgi:hypothetical protein